MKEINAIFFCGHLSDFGFAFLKPLLQSEIIKIESIIIASNQRWEIFKSNLLEKHIKLNDKEKRKSEQRYTEITNYISQVDTDLIIAEDVNQESFFTDLSEDNVVISAAYPQIFSGEFLSHFTRQGINFHPSYLPLCRGAHPIYWTIASGEELGGLSCHYLTEKLDSGDLLSRIKIPVDNSTIYSDLYQQVLSSIPQCIQDVEDVLQGKKESFPQDGRISYFRNDKWYHHQLSFQSESTKQIIRKINTEYAFISYGYMKRNIRDVEIIHADYRDLNDIPLGSIVRSQRNRIYVRAKDGILQLELEELSSFKLKELIKKLISSFVLRKGYIFQS